MAQERPSERVTVPVPPAAVAEWLQLCRVLEASGPVPCHTDADPSAWWPDGHATHAPAAYRAVLSCRRCPAAAPCLSYALAADERFGVWGGTLPEERRAMRWEAAE